MLGKKVQPIDDIPPLDLAKLSLDAPEPKRPKYIAKAGDCKARHNTFFKQAKQSLLAFNEREEQPKKSWFCGLCG